MLTGQKEADIMTRKFYVNPSRLYRFTNLRYDQLISISGRSNGQIRVQKINQKGE